MVTRLILFLDTSKPSVKKRKPLMCPCERFWAAGSFCWRVNDRLLVHQSMRVYGDVRGRAGQPPVHVGKRDKTPIPIYIKEVELLLPLFQPLVGFLHGVRRAALPTQHLIRDVGVPLEEWVAILTGVVVNNALQGGQWWPALISTPAPAA